MSNYLRIIINENSNSFYIIETSKRPTYADGSKIEDLALKTLKKIEFVVKNNLAYVPRDNDNYLIKSQDDILNILKTKSHEICNKYCKKQSDLNWIFRKVFSKKKEVKAVLKRISSYIKPAQLLPIDNDCIQGLAKYLDVSDLCRLANVNRHGKAEAEKAIITRAKELGYQGAKGLDSTQASKYIGNLFKEVVILADSRVIPSSYVVYKENSFFQNILKSEIDTDKTLNKLKDLSKEDLLTIISHGKFYTLNCKNLTKLLVEKVSLNKTEISSSTIKGKAVQALFLSAIMGNREVAEFLLKNGIDPNIKAKNGNCPLHFATKAGNLDLVKLLIENNANINEKGKYDSTALYFACKFQQRDQRIAKFLLEKNADPNIKGKNGNCPLHFAVKAANLDLVKLLVENKALINETNQRGYTPLFIGYELNVFSEKKVAFSKVVDFLLEKGADPTIPNIYGKTVVVTARSYFDTSSVNKFLAKRKK